MYMCFKEEMGKKVNMDPLEKVVNRGAKLRGFFAKSN